MAVAVSEVPRALNELERHALLWLVGQGDLEPVVRSACDLLVEGANGDALAALAAMSVKADRWSSEVEDAVFSALAEQGRSLPPRGTHEAQAAAVTANTALDWLAGFAVSMAAARAWTAEPDLAEWVDAARLNLFRGVLDHAAEPRMAQAFERFGLYVKPAMARLQELRSSSAGLAPAS